MAEGEDRPRQVDAGWLREQYETNRRSLKDITAETGVPVADLATLARSAGITVRHGINGHANPLAALGGPDDFPPAVWAAFARPGADKRIRRLLAAPGHPSLARAARHLGTKHETLATQIAQLEAATGTRLLRHAPGTGLTLTPDGEQFAHDVQPVLGTWNTRRTTAAGTIPRDAILLQCPGRGSGRDRDYCT